MISIFLYGIVFALVAFIILRLIKEPKIKPSDLIALLGIVISVILALNLTNNPPIDNLTPTEMTTLSSPTDIPSFTPTQTALLSTSVPSSTEALNWAISFEYRFPAGFWSVGTHEYTLNSECLTIELDENGGHSSSRTQTFEVSENAELLPGDVYLRISGLKDAPFESNGVDKISPLQTTTAVWSLIEMPQSDAELAVRDCTVTVMWDGGIPKQLTPKLPFQR